MRIGTSHFISRHHAVRYFAKQNETAADVDAKIKEGVISIGRPETLVTERCSVDSDGRYWIQTAEARR